MDDGFVLNNIVGQRLGLGKTNQCAYNRSGFHGLFARGRR
jgi:hypothetical protein